MALATLAACGSASPVAGTSLLSKVQPVTGDAAAQKMREQKFLTPMAQAPKPAWKLNLSDVKTGNATTTGVDTFHSFFVEADPAETDAAFKNNVVMSLMTMEGSSVSAVLFSLNPDTKTVNWTGGTHAGTTTCAPTGLIDGALPCLTGDTLQLVDVKTGAAKASTPVPAAAQADSVWALADGSDVYAVLLGKGGYLLNAYGPDLKTRYSQTLAFAPAQTGSGTSRGFSLPVEARRPVIAGGQLLVPGGILTDGKASLFDLKTGQPAADRPTGALIALPGGKRVVMPSTDSVVITDGSGAPVTTVNGAPRIPYSVDGDASRAPVFVTASGDGDSLQRPVTAYDAKSGVKLWTQLGDPIAICGDTVVLEAGSPDVGATNVWMTGNDLRSGKEQWKKAVRPESEPLCAGEAVVLATDGNQGVAKPSLDAFSVADGHTLWSVRDAFAGTNISTLSLRGTLLTQFQQNDFTRWR